MLLPNKPKPDNYLLENLDCKNIANHWVLQSNKSVFFTSNLLYKHEIM